MAAVTLEGKIYALGGRWRGAGEMNSVEVFDPATGAWKPGPPMNAPRAGFAATVIKGQIAVLGGEIIYGGNATLESVELFDPAAGQFPSGGFCHTAWTWYALRRSW